MRINWLRHNLVEIVPPSLGDKLGLTMAGASENFRLSLPLIYVSDCLRRLVPVHYGHRQVHEYETVGDSLLQPSIYHVYGVLPIISRVHQVIQSFELS